MEQRTATTVVYRIGADGCVADSDQLAVEEPLEIRLEYGPPSARSRRSVSITMRTPGDDFALAVGFLFGEQIIRHGDQIAHVRFCGPPVGAQRLRNVVRVALRPEAAVALERLDRHFYTTSSCGVCGKASLDALGLPAGMALPADTPPLASAVVHRLPGRLRSAQAVFEQTGGLHAAALFRADGTLELLREDVGRHNAVDKLIGTRLLAGATRLDDHVLFVSGRASFELVQKAVIAGIPVLAAVGAPSSLAVALAAERGLTLIGFVRDARFNIYSHPGRVVA